MPIGAQVTCRKCKRTFVPSFMFDFYPDGEDPAVGLCESCLMAQAFANVSPRNEPFELPAGYKDDVCRVGKGKATCSFLIAGAGGLCCAKGSTFEAPLRKRREEGSMGALGDNCSGSPDFTPTKNPR